MSNRQRNVSIARIWWLPAAAAAVAIAIVTGAWAQGGSSTGSGGPPVAVRIAIGLALAVAVTGACWLAIGRRLAVRMAALAERVEQMAGGEAGQRAGPLPDDLGPVVDGLDHLAEQLQAAGDRAERLQRELTDANDKLEKLNDTILARDGVSMSAFGDPLESTIEMLNRLDPDLRWLRSSRPEAKLLGWSAEELVGRDYLEVVHPDDRRVVRKALRKCRALGESHDVVYRVMTRSNEVRQLQVDAAARYDDDGHCIAIRCHATDITEQVRARQEVRRRTEQLAKANTQLRRMNAELARLKDRYLDLYNNSPVMYYSLDADGIIVRSNDTMVKLLGYAQEELEGKPYTMLLTPAMQEIFPRTFEEFRHSGTLVLETQWRKASGDVMDVWVRSTARYDKEGRFAQSRSVAQDITEQKQAEGLLQESEARFRELYDHAPVGYHEVDTEGRITRINRRELEVLGYTAEEMLGRPVWEFIVEEETSREAVLAKTAGLMPPGKAFERAFRRKDGATVPALLQDDMLRDEKGRIVGIRSTVQDITERKEAEEKLKSFAKELERSNRELEQFAYVASHDLQEPLRMVASYVQLLERRYGEKLDDDATEFIGFAVDGAKRMQNMINALLAYSRVGTRGGHFETTDVNAAVDEAVADLRGAIEDNRATVTRDELPTVLADRTQLSQLFLKLIANAIKFHGDEPPVVHVSAKKNDAEWVFTVKDNGIGIDPKHAERVFAIFQRLHGRTEYPGTGIGLAICKRIVERHDGRIWLDSELGKGTAFRFTLAPKGPTTP